MTKYPDGSILILPDEISGLDRLISYIDYPGLEDKHDSVCTNVDRFIRKWKELSTSYRARNEN